MDIQLKEPKLLYVYEYIKIDKNRLPAINGRPFEIGDLLLTEDSNKSKKYYKFICIIRRAFIGDMQKDFDRYYECNNMLNYANCKDNVMQDVKYKTVYIYTNRCKSIFKRIKEYIQNKFLKMKLNYTPISPEEKDRGLTSLEDFLSDKNEI